MREVEELALEVEELNAALKLALAERDEWHRQNGVLRGELKQARDNSGEVWLAERCEQLRDERDGHRRRQVEAERALMLLLIREGGRTEFTPKEMISAPSDGSFVSSTDPATGNEVLEFVAARQKPE